MASVTLTDQQRLRIAELPDDYRMIGVDRSAPLVRKPTGQIMRVQQNGRLTAATSTAKRRLAAHHGDKAGRRDGVRKSRMRTPTQADAQAKSPPRAQPESVSSLRLRRLEGTTQAVLATLRRSLVEKVQPTRDGLAHEAAIAFDLNDDQRALAIIDEIAQTVGISALS
jgi:hypothetical protein